MNGWKSLLQSRTVWFALAIIVLNILAEVMPIDKDAWIAKIDEILNILLGMGVIYGRKSATKRIVGVLPARGLR